LNNYAFDYLNLPGYGYSSASSKYYMFREDGTPFSPEELTILKLKGLIFTYQSDLRTS